jgi:hypothetical protein
VKLPGIGTVDKKYVYIGGALVVGIVGYAYWNNARSSGAEMSDYTTEPDYAMDSGVDGYVNPGGSQAPVEQDFLAKPSNNAEWGQKAISVLIDTGFDPIEASTAVGRYLMRADLSVKQADMIRAAHGQLGPPPTGSYPINSTSTPNTPTTELPKLTAPAGLSAHDIGSTTAGFLWNAVTGARWYTLHLSNGKTYNTASTHVSVTGLRRNTSYKAQVRAVDMNKKPGPLSPSRSFRTKR